MKNCDKWLDKEAVKELNPRYISKSEKKESKKHEIAEKMKGKGRYGLRGVPITKKYEKDEGEMGGKLK